MGVLRGKVGLARVQRWFEHIYGLDLQVEGEGVVLPSLEATLSLHEGKVGLRLKTKVNLLDNSERRIVRFPDRHSVNAKEAVKSIVIGLGIKCVWYSMSEEDIRARQFLPRAAFPSLIPPEFPNFQMICINVKTGFHMLFM